MRIIAIDYGTRRIGFASWCDNVDVVVPLNPLRVPPGADPVRLTVDRLAEEGCDRIVVGLPLNMDGTDSDMTRAVRDFADRVLAETGIEVEFEDERLSSLEAGRQAARTKRRRDGRIDSLAAAVILKAHVENRR